MYPSHSISSRCVAQMFLPTLFDRSASAAREVRSDVCPGAASGGAAEADEEPEAVRTPDKAGQFQGP